MILATVVPTVMIVLTVSPPPSAVGEADWAGRCVSAATV